MRTEINGYLQHLKSVCPELTDAELLTFGNGLKVSTIKKGSIYIAAGKMQKQGGFLANGLIRAFHTDDSGKEKNIYFIPENDYTFHYASFMDHKPSPLTFQCLEQSTIINFSFAHLRNAYDNISKFDRYGRLIVEGKLKMQQQRLERLLYQTAEQRYLAFTQEFPTLFNRISISHLCSYLGVERQTLTRIRQKLAKSK